MTGASGSAVRRVRQAGSLAWLIAAACAADGAGEPAGGSGAAVEESGGGGSTAAESGAGGAGAGGEAGRDPLAGGGRSAGAGSGEPSGAGTGAGAGDGASGAAAGSGEACSELASADTTLVELEPVLFSDGGDPSGTPECADVLNPERGLFEFRDLRALGSLAGARAGGHTLIYGKVLIDDYRARDLDAALLDPLSAAFAAARDAGVKVLPRVYYAADGQAEDAPLPRVLAHIEQLTPLLRANADVIAVLHAGFVGAWGEWHSSSNDLTEPDARKAIFDAILAALPEDRMTMSRRPSFKEAAYGGPLTAATMFSGSALSRVGHLNDCFLASDDDVGTYQLSGERDYAIADSAFVPVGGETCGVYPERSDCEPAQAEMALLHWSFLNADYHEDVLDGWRSQGCLPAIACRLGYRFVLLRHASAKSSTPGGRLSLALRLVNDGFARMYNPRPVELVLDGPVRRALPVDADPRAWAPGEPVELCLTAELPADLPSGSYQLGLRLPDAAESLRDDPDYAVRIANASWDAATGTNLLDATVTIAP